MGDQPILVMAEDFDRAGPGHGAGDALRQVEFEAAIEQIAIAPGADAARLGAARDVVPVEIIGQPAAQGFLDQQVIAVSVMFLRAQRIGDGNQVTMLIIAVFDQHLLFSAIAARHRQEAARIVQREQIDDAVGASDADQVPGRVVVKRDVVAIAVLDPVQPQLARTRRIRPQQEVQAVLQPDHPVIGSPAGRDQLFGAMIEALPRFQLGQHDQPPFLDPQQVAAARRRQRHVQRMMPFLAQLAVLGR